MADVFLKGVWKIYQGRIEAVKDMNLQIKDGEFVSLLGPSGCGKSSTLRMIAGLEEVTRGDLLIGGRRMNNVEPGDRDVAMVFENYALLPHMTAYRNIAFPLTLRGEDKKVVDERVHEISTLLDLDGLLDTLAVYLGGGERQRVGIARALIRKASVLLMDEPISHLDADLRARTRGELARLQRVLGITTVYVTHDQLEALAMSDKIAVMNEGVVQQFGTPDELYNSPANLFVANFVGEPPMNLIPARLDRDGEGSLRIRGKGNGFEIRLSGEKARKIDPGYREGDVVFGIRPPDFALGTSGAADRTHVRAGVTSYEAGCEHAYLEAKIGEAVVLVECQPDRRFSEGDSIDLDLAAGRFQVFDGMSGKSIMKVGDR